MKRLLMIVCSGLLVATSALAQTQETPKLNKKNLVIKEWNTDPNGGNKAIDHMTTYNPDGKKIDEVEYNSDGQKWRKRYEYGPDNKVSKEYVYDHRNRLQTYKTFEYNEFGRKKVQLTYNAKGRLIAIKNYEYISQDN